MKLKSVFLISRHGDRSPIASYPGDLSPVTDSSIWPNGAAHLTPEGEKTMKQLADDVKQHYEKNLLNGSSLDVKAVCSGQDRCVDSITVFLKQLLPDREVKHVVDDRMLNCVNTDPDVWNQSVKLVDQEKQRLEKEQGTLFQRLRDEYGISFVGQNSVIKFYTFCDTVLTQAMAGKKMPEWVTSEVVSHLQNNLQSVLNTFSQSEVFDWAIDPLVKRLHEMMTSQAVDKTDNKLLWISNTHDVNIGYVLRLLNAYDPSVCPAYAATVTLELWQDESSNFSVRSFYWNSSEGLSYPGRVLRQKECPDNDFTPLRTFLSLLMQYQKHD